MKYADKTPVFFTGNHESEHRRTVPLCSPYEEKPYYSPDSSVGKVGKVGKDDGFQGV